MAGTRQAIKLFSSSNSSNSSNNEASSSDSEPYHLLRRRHEDCYNNKHNSEEKKTEFNQSRKRTARPMHSLHSVKLLTNTYKRKKKRKQASSDSDYDSQDHPIHGRKQGQRKQMRGALALENTQQRTATASSGTLTRRGRRGGSTADGEMRDISEGMNFYELQAQEQVMARFQAQKRRKASMRLESSSTTIACVSSTPTRRTLDKSSQLIRHRSGNEMQGEERARKQIFPFSKSHTVTSLPCVLMKQYDRESGTEEDEEREEKEWKMFTKKSAQREYFRKRKLNVKNADARMMDTYHENEVPAMRKRTDFHKPTCKHQVVTKNAGRKRLGQHQAANCKTRQQAVPITSQSNLGEVESDWGSEEQNSKDGSEIDEIELVPLAMSGRQKNVESRKKGASKQHTAKPSKRRLDENSMPALQCQSHAAQASSRTVLLDTRATQCLTEKLSLRELQEQEKLLLFFHAQKKRLSSAVRKERHEAHSTNTTAKMNGTGRRARLNQKKLSGALLPSTYLAPPFRNGFLASNAQFISAAGCAAMTTEKLANPVIHSTAWRRLVFEETPPNILADVSATPYSFGSDKPLWAYDTTGELQTKCKLIAVDVNVASSEDNVEKQPPSQSEVNNRVRTLVKQELPQIQICHARRVRDTLREMRLQLFHYRKAHQVLRGERSRRLQWSKIASHQSWLHLSPTERIAAKRVFQNPSRTALPYNSLVGGVRYFVHQSQTHLGSLVYPETVTLLSNDISAICRSFTMVGIRKNTFVEDDPIFRYVPYLGDGERMTIDNDLYSGTTMSKERRIAVFGEGEELQVLSPGARDDEIMECLLRVLVGKCGASEEVFLALQHEEGFKRPRMDYCSMTALAETEQRIAKRVAKVKKMVALHDISFSDELAEISATQGDASKCLRKLAQPHWFLHDKSEPQLLAIRLQPPLSAFESSYADSPEALGIRDRTTYEGITEWYRDLFCRRCYFYDCLEHGIQNPQRSVRTDPIYPMVTVPGIVLARQEVLSQEVGMSAEDVSPYSSTSPAEVVLIGSSSSDDDIEESKDQHLASTPSALQSATLYRRSRRAQTRISSLASKSLHTQEKMLETERLAELEKRKRRREKFARTANKSEYLDNSYLPAVTASLKKLLSKTKPCGPSCWLPAGTMDSSEEYTPLRQVDSVLVQKLESILGPNACILSAMLKSPRCTCAQISRFLAEEKRQQDSSKNMGAGKKSSVSTERQRKGRRGAGVSSNRSSVKRIREQRIYDREKRLSYEPCNHNGVCNESCECTKRSHSCNKACSCTRDCPNRFQGCKCSTGNCHTLACPCWSAGRECDPDYCFNCGASDAAVITFHPEFKSQSSYNLGICHNVNMLRGSIQKKIGIAFSAIHGWGAYALEPIRKDEFVVEYTGELITDDEAERRGAIYDRKSLSYLFGVNSDYVVDAARKGNKSKFANHKAKEGANLDVRVITSNGEHRIGLFAREAIEVGAEVFFDYGYTHDSAPKWSQHDQFQFEKRAYDIIDDENEWEQWD